MQKNQNIEPHYPLPVDIVLAPGWWFKNEGITFDEDFFFHMDRRVLEERRMEKALYDRWGRYGPGKHRHDNRPEIGAVHLAAGFLLSQMLGCEVIYREDQPPQVITANRESLSLDPEQAFLTPVFLRFRQLMDDLKSRYGYLTGDVNWGGILNIALDLRGQNLFVDMMDRPNEVKNFFSRIAEVIFRFVSLISAETGTSSVSVNRNVMHLKQPVMLHSECSHTMISVEHYNRFLYEYDDEWSRQRRPYGIHYCGLDPHRFSTSFARLPRLDFLDVGWGGNVESIRKMLPRTFLNIRLSPVEIITQSAGEIQEAIRSRVKTSGNPWLTGVSCINMDDQVPTEKITVIFETVENLRKEIVSEHR